MAFGLYSGTPQIRARRSIFRPRIGNGPLRSLLAGLFVAWPNLSELGIAAIRER
jgi:hypothetical protein